MTSHHCFHFFPFCVASGSFSPPPPPGGAGGGGVLPYKGLMSKYRLSNLSFFVLIRVSIYQILAFRLYPQQGSQKCLVFQSGFFLYSSHLKCSASLPLLNSFGGDLASRCPVVTLFENCCYYSQRIRNCSGHTSVTERRVHDYEKIRQYFRRRVISLRNRIILVSKCGCKS